MEQLPVLPVTAPQDRLVEHVLSAREGCACAARGDLFAAAACFARIKVNVGAANAWGGKEALAELKGWLKAVRELGARLTEAAGDQPVGPADERAAEALQCWRVLWDFVTGVYDGLKQELRGLDFDDLERLAWRLLSAEPRDERVQAAVDGINHLVVDEFQDVNEVQGEILTALAGLSAGGKFFAVGDAKQSIYRFRQAQVKVFNGVMREIYRRTGCEALPLNRSFRTHAALLAALNEAFETVLQPVGASYADFEARPAALDPERPPLAPCEAAPGSVEILVVPPALAAAARRAEAALLARRLHDLVDRRFLVWDRRTGVFAAGPVRRRCHPLPCHHLPAALRRGLQGRRSSLPHRERPRLLRPPGSARPGRAARLPAQPRRRPEHRRRPSLAHVQPERRDTVPPALVHPGRCALARGHPLLCRACRSPSHLPGRRSRSSPGNVRRLARGRRPSRRLDPPAPGPRPHRLRGDPGPCRYGGDDRDSRRRRPRPGQPGQVPAACPRSAAEPNLSAFLQSVQDLSAREAREGEALPGTPDAGAVQIMSVHAAKGLEFPVVVLADLGRSARGPAGSPRIIHDPLFGLACQVRDENGEWLSPAGYRWAEWLDARMERAESSRLLYVACTRAADLLILSGSAKEKDSWLQTLAAAWGLDLAEAVEERTADRSETFDRDGYRLRVSWPVPPDVEPARLPAYALPAAGLASALAAVPPLAQPLPLRPARWPVAVTHLPGDQDSTDQLPPLRPIVQLAAAAPAHGAPGTSCSATWPTARLPIGIASRLPAGELRERLVRWARRGGLFAADDVSAAVGRVMSLFDHLRATPLYRDICASSQRHAEVPLSICAGERMLHGILDLLYCDSQGQWRLLDWKTEPVRRGQSLADAAVGPYLRQMAVYSRAVEQILGIRAHAQICFLSAHAAVYDPPEDELEREWHALLVEP